MVARDLSPWGRESPHYSFPPGGRTRFNSRASSALRAEEEERKRAGVGFPSRGSKPLATTVRPPGEESRALGVLERPVCRGFRVQGGAAVSPARVPLRRLP